MWGLVYSLEATDEAKLDVDKGVPYEYEKLLLPVEVWYEVESEGGKVKQLGKKQWALCYVDRQRILEGVTRVECVQRMNMGIRDALEKGMPTLYVDKQIRPFIPEKPGHIIGKEAELERGC